MSELINDVFQGGSNREHGLGGIDESQLDLMDDDEIGNLALYIHDPNENDLPSMKFSIWILLIMFMSFLIAGGIFTYVAIRLSQRQEQHAAKAKTAARSTTLREGQEADRKSHHQKKLECKPWGGGGWKNDDDDDDKTQDMTEAFIINSTRSIISSQTDVSDPESLLLNQECCITTITSKDHHDRNSTSICRLCNEAFEYGQPIYTSNNPKCSHQFHTVCMDRWLSLQNSCPICNEAYALHNV